MLRRRFPFYRQLEAMDCGPTCLRMVARYYGRDVPVDLLREASHLARQGVSMVGLCDAAEAIGLRPSAAAASFADLARERPFPAIVHWRDNHFVVLHRIDRRRRAHVADPAHGPAVLAKHEFERHAAGPLLEGGEREATILYFEPTPAFFARESAGGSQWRALATLFHYALPYRGHFVQVGFAMAAASLISLVLAFLNQTLVDVAVGGRNPGLVDLILIAQLLLFLGSAAGEYSRNWLTLHMGSRINIAMMADFLAKLTRLPMAFFEGRMTGDLIQRMADLDRIRTFLTSTLLTMAFMLLNLVLYSSLLLYYDTTIFAVFFVGSAAYFGWILLFLRKRKELDYRRFDASAENQSGLIGLIEGMQEIKMHGAERRSRWRWERVQIRLFKVSLGSLALEQSQGFGSMSIHRVKNILVTYLAARAVIRGEITLGMMMTVQFVIGNLEAPVTNLVNFARSLQDAKLGIERVDQVLGREDEEPAGQPALTRFPPDRTLALRGVSFSYGGSSAPLVLEGVDLTIPEGKVTAIVGASGSGKTTLLKLLLRYYAPTSGAIELGGRDFAAFRSSAWRTRCGVVMQDGWIFSDTVAGNIALADEVPDEERLRYAARLANVTEFVERLPLGFGTVIGREGLGLSGGQRQRILIARAVYRDPEYLFFDEATSSLDAENERAIMHNLAAFYRGRTVVVIAHRLSTVRAADQIVVLSQGRIIERGTHEQLARSRGAYFSLVRNQLELAAS